LVEKKKEISSIKATIAEKDHMIMN